MRGNSLAVHWTTVLARAELLMRQRLPLVSPSERELSPAPWTRRPAALRFGAISRGPRDATQGGNPMRLLTNSVVATVLLAWVTPAAAGPRYKGFERGEALIAVDELKTLMDARDA